MTIKRKIIGFVVHLVVAFSPQSRGMYVLSPGHNNLRIEPVREPFWAVFKGINLPQAWGDRFFILVFVGQRPILSPEIRIWCWYCCRLFVLISPLSPEEPAKSPQFPKNPVIHFGISPPPLQLKRLFVSAAVILVNSGRWVVVMRSWENWQQEDGVPSFAAIKRRVLAETLHHRNRVTSSG